MATTKKTALTSTPVKKTVSRQKKTASSAKTVTEGSTPTTTPVDISQRMLNGLNNQIRLIFSNEDPVEHQKTIQGFLTLQQTCKTLGDKFFTSNQLTLIEKTLKKIQEHFEANPLVENKDNYYQKIDSSFFFKDLDSLSLAEAYFFETNVKVTPQQMSDYLNVSLAMSHMAPEDKYEEVPWDKIILSKDGSLSLPAECISLVDVQGDLSLNQAMYHMANKCPHTSKNYVLKWLRNAVAIYSFVENAYAGTSNKSSEFFITEEEWKKS